jgi:thiol-disulfide isomerase/thioredoxin
MIAAFGILMLIAKKKMKNIPLVTDHEKILTLTDKNFQHQTKNKIVLVDFWASWCAECRPEMPVLERLHREFTARGLTVIGVNAREGKEAVGRYAHALGLTFPLVLDPDGAISAGYGVIGLPTTFVVARDGRAVALAVGPREWGSASARALIRTLPAEPVPAPTLVPTPGSG